MDNMKLIFLGGVRENAKNMYALEVNDQIFVLDCGLKYPENELRGIDVVIPDFTYLKENAHKVVGVFLTHGHPDAIGALPYFLSEINVPVFGSELTIALAKLAVKNSDQIKKFNDFHVISADSEIDFDDVTVSFFKTTHSIPESLGIALTTPAGTVVYTGDFKFDQTAASPYQTDLARLAQLGQNGVVALLSDSANAENPFEIVTERQIYDYIAEQFEYHQGRIVVACVAANIMRVQQIFNAAAQTDRKVVLTGHDAQQIVHTALKLNKLHLPQDDLLITTKEMDKFKPDQLVILEAGKAGEPLKSLQKMAQGRHRTINLGEGDLAFITTTPSHAMETMLARTRDMIYRSGADVKSIADEFNCSGHASRNDLQLMMNLLHPKYVIPVQGEYRLMAANAEWAQELGIPADHIFLPKLGDVLAFDHGKLLHAAAVEAGNTMIDGSGVGDIGNIVLRDRKVLAEDGIFVAVVTIDRRHKKIVDEPKLTSRGFIYVKSNKQLMSQAQALVAKVVQRNLDNKEFDWSRLKQAIREKLNHFWYEQTHRHPVILPIIMEVNPHRGGCKAFKNNKKTAKTKPTAKQTHHKGKQNKPTKRRKNTKRPRRKAAPKAE